MDPMDKLAKNDQINWGEDIFALATRSEDPHLAQQAVEAVAVHYRRELRDRFQSDPAVKEAIRPGVPVLECLDDIHFAVADVCREGTEEIFTKILKELVEELEVLQKSGGELFLVDHSTGKTIMPIQEKHIYQPPDFVDEQGKIRKARPIVHPSISAPLMLHEHEKAKQAGVLAKITPENHLAFAHLTDPDYIAKTAVDILKKNGIEIVHLEEGEKATIEIGKEHIQGIEQAPNFKFHRAHLFGSILARRILEVMNRRGKCDEKIKVSMKRNSKFRWYQVDFTYSA